MAISGNQADAISRFVVDLSDDILQHKLTSAVLEQQDNEYAKEFVLPGWIKIPTVLVDKLGFYVPTNDLLAVANSNLNLYADYNGNVASNNRAGYPIKGASISWRLYQVRFNRAAQFKIDTFTDWTSGQVLTARVLNEFYKQAVIPEIDATRYSIIASATSTQLGNRVLEDLTKDTVVASFDTAVEKLFENGAEEEGLVLFVSPQVETYLKQASNFYRTFQLLDKDVIVGVDGEGKSVMTRVKAYNNIPIIRVPSDRFFTDVSLNENGFLTSATSRKINYLLVHVDYAYAIRLLQSTKAFAPEVVQDYDGWKINYHLWHDLIVPEHKKVAFYASLANSLLGANKTDVMVDSVAGSSSGTTIIDGIFSEPKALNYAKIYVKTTAFGDIGTTQSGGTLVEVGSQFTPAASSLYVVLTDNAGTILAKSSSTVAFNVAS